MKLFATRFLIAVITLCVGLLAHGLWRDRQTKPAKEEPVPVLFCELLREPERYDGKLIITRAELHRDQKPFIYDWSCNLANSYSMTPLVRVMDDVEHVLPAWADDSSYCANGKNAKEMGSTADVVIIGTFQADYLTPKIAPAFKIIPQSVQQVPPTSK